MSLLNEEFIVYIPTRKRVDFQFTYDLLTQFSFLRDRVFLVVHPDEAHEHASRGRNIIIRPHGQIHYIWEFMRTRTEDPNYFFIIDDDLGLFSRKSDDPETWNLQKLEPGVHDEKMEELFSICLQKLKDGYVHGTLSARQGNSFTKQPGFENGRANAFHYFNRSETQRFGLNMSLSGLHDIHSTLHLLERGCPNYVISNFCWDQRRGSNADGGCSVYRDPAWQTEEVHKLSMLHPETVKVVVKRPKQGWGDGFKERTDVRVSWKKAAKIGEKNAKS